MAQAKASRHLLIGRGGVIRTHDPLRPRQVRYQAALRPDIYRFLHSKPLTGFSIWSRSPNAAHNASDRDKTPSIHLVCDKAHVALVRLAVQLFAEPPVSSAVSFASTF